MWCYMLGTLTSDRIKKKKTQGIVIHCIYFIALKEIIGGGGGTNDTPYMDDLAQERPALVC